MISAMKRNVWIFLLTSVFFVLLSCSARKEDPKRVAWGECIQNRDCSGGRICRNRKCVDPPPALPVDARTPPENMVHVPAGGFILGSNRGSPLERPQVDSVTQDFYIDIREVSREEYLTCVKAGHCSAARCEEGQQAGKLPVTCVSQPDAAAYCAFARGRLPTEEEWEKAARGTDARTYPWGDAVPDCDKAVFAGCTEGSPAPSGSRPGGAGPFGTLDQAGNVWEWTATPRHKWDKDKDPERRLAGHAPASDLEAEMGEPDRFFVVRGGSFLDSPVSLRTTNRLLLDKDFHSRALGFRCVRDPGWESGHDRR